MTEGQIRTTLRRGYTAMPGALPLWKARLLAETWRLHFDLPTEAEAERLAYTVNRWPDALEMDLRIHAGGADLGELWRARQWRLLLNLIDHLPGHSHYATAQSRDEEYAAELAKVLAQTAEKPDGKRQGPPMTHWTPEVAAITRLTDVVAATGTMQAKVAAGKDANKIPDPKPELRPSSLLGEARARAEYDRRRSVHESLVSRLLPHKAAQQG